MIEVILMAKFAAGLASVAVAIAMAFNVWTYCLFVTGQVAFGVPFTTSYGLLVGMMGVTGIAYARMFWVLARRDDDVPCYAMSFGILALVALYAYMQWTGEFGERIFGEFASNFGFSAGIGAVVGASLMPLMWLGEREISTP